MTKRYQQDVHTEIRELAKLYMISSSHAQAAIDRATALGCAKYEKNGLAVTETVNLFLELTLGARAIVPRVLKAVPDRIKRNSTAYQTKTLRDAAAVLEAVPGQRTGPRSVKNLIGIASFLRNLADEIGGEAFIRR